MDKSLEPLSEFQKTVLEIVWDLGEASVRDVLSRIERKKKPAYTTILTVMQVLERKGWLSHRTESRGSYVYVPTISRHDANIATVRGFIHRLFRGDSKAMFQHLLDDEALSESDIAELKVMISRRRKPGEGAK